jgi:transposase InsO family protein
MSLVDQKVQQWKANGTIKEAPVGCAYNNPLVVVAKKDEFGKISTSRVCLDPRLINSDLQDDRFPVPVIQDIFDQLNGAEIFTTLDLKESYHQFRIRECDQVKTAFTWQGKQYVFVGAPFGLKHLSSVFQRVMRKVFDGADYILNYIDDIVIYSKSVEDHEIHVQDAIRRLNSVHLRINTAKCHFFKQSIKLLGFTISKEGIHADREKLDKVPEWPRPTNTTEMQRFLGFANYFRRATPNYAKVAAPLEQIKYSKNYKADWTQKQESAFAAMKELLTSQPLLRFPDFRYTFNVATDASNVGLGAVLYQQIEMDDKRSKIHVIAYASRALSNPEKNYSATKKELLAIVFALEKFRTYIWGSHFTLYTDHQALVYLFSQKSMSPMMAGWIDKILDYNFEIVYRKGIENVVPDALSRIPECNESPSDLTVCALSVPQAEDTGSTNARAGILERIHLQGHIGVAAMRHELALQGHQWDGIARDCQETVTKCIDCARVNVGKQGFHPLRPISANLPFDHIAVDLLSLPNSNAKFTQVLVVVDVCTRFTVLRPLKHKTAKAVASELWNIFALFGVPKIIQSDNGKEFVNKLVTALYRVHGVEQRLVSSYHPSANGVVERMNRTIIQLLRKLVHGNPQDWHKYISFVQYSINNKVASLHNSKPFDLMFGRASNGFQDFRQVNGVAVTPREVRDRWRWMQEAIYPGIQQIAEASRSKMVKSFGRARRVSADEIPAGTKVMIKNVVKSSKLDSEFVGPCEIVRRNRNGTYVLANLAGRVLQRRVPFDQIKVVSSGIVSDGVFEVEEILKHRGRSPNREMLIKWKDYPEEEISWIPESFVVDKSLVQDYWRSRARGAERG